MDEKVKVKWYLSLPFIIVVFLVSFPIFTIPGLVLFIVRAVLYPKKRVSTIIIMGVCYIAIISFVVWIANYESEDTKAINSYIEQQNYEGALAYIEENYSNGSRSYYEERAYVLESAGDYDNAASELLRYIVYLDDESLVNASSIINKLSSYKEYCSSDIVAAIELAENMYEEAESNRVLETDEVNEDVDEQEAEVQVENIVEEVESEKEEQYEIDDIQDETVGTYYIEFNFNYEKSKGLNYRDDAVILIDGNEVGHLNYGSSASFGMFLDEGKHTIQLRRDATFRKSKTNKIKIDVNDNYKCYVKVYENALSGLRIKLEEK